MCYEEREDNGAHVEWMQRNERERERKERREIQNEDRMDESDMEEEPVEQNKTLLFLINHLILCLLFFPIGLLATLFLDTRYYYLHQT
jgi:hypothetical protein